MGNYDKGPLRWHPIKGILRGVGGGWRSQYRVLIVNHPSKEYCRRERRQAYQVKEGGRKIIIVGGDRSAEVLYLWMASRRRNSGQTSTCGQTEGQSSSVVTPGYY